MGNVEVEIRKARLDDTGDMFQIDEICFSSPWTEEAFFNEIECNPNAFYFVAVCDKIVVGYIGFWRILDEAHVTNVAVSPKYRKFGIGKKLVEKVLEESRKLGILRVTLEVRVSNQTAINLYSSFGFVEAGIRPKYYVDNGEDAIIMWLELY